MGVNRYKRQQEKEMRKSLKDLRETLEARKKVEREWNTREWVKNAIPVFEKHIIMALKNAKWSGFFKDRKVVFLDFLDYGGFKYEKGSSYYESIEATSERAPYSSHIYEILVIETQKRHPEWSIGITKENGIQVIQRRSLSDIKDEQKKSNICDNCGITSYDLKNIEVATKRGTKTKHVCYECFEVWKRDQNNKER